MSSTFFPNETRPLGPFAATPKIVTSTQDPGVNDDVTKGFGVGSVLYNTSNSRMWTMLANTVGAAIWFLSGVVPGVGIEPSSMLTYFGGGLATFPEEGNIARQIVSAGVQPGATGADNVLAVFSLPAASFDLLGRGIVVSASGSFGATANNKRIKIIFNATTAVVGSTVTGGTTVADTATIATNGGGWAVQANIFKYGALGSNTQMGIHTQAQIGAAVAAMLAPTLITAVESGAILIAITGNATTAASDIVFNFLEINAMN